jgi:hypothetical protein
LQRNATLGALGALVRNSLRCNALNRLAALVHHFCVGTQNLHWYALQVANLRWNAEQTTSRPMHVQLAYERYSARRAYYQRIVVLRFPLERTTDD